MKGTEIQTNAVGRFVIIDWPVRTNGVDPKYREELLAEAAAKERNFGEIAEVIAAFKDGEHALKFVVELESGQLFEGYASHTFTMLSRDYNRSYFRLDTTDLKSCMRDGVALLSSGIPGNDFLIRLTHTGLNKTQNVRITAKNQEQAKALCIHIARKTIFENVYGEITIDKMLRVI